MMNRILPLLYFILVSITAQAETGPSGSEVPGEFIPAGFLDEMGLLQGKVDDWRETIDALSRLGFGYVASTEPPSSAEIENYLRGRDLAVRRLSFADAGSESGLTPGTLLAIEGEAQKAWLAGGPDLGEGIEPLWADNGAGTFNGWPVTGSGVRFGILLRAGGTHNGPVQDPYPARIADSIAAALQRGLDANVLVSAPSFRAFELNLEAAAMALRNPPGFDADVFYGDWAAERFGNSAGPTAVRSMKLLHAAQEPVGGFASVTEQSRAIVTGLKNGESTRLDQAAITQALDYAQRAAELAAQAVPKVAPGNAGQFEREISLPANLMLRNLELLDSLARLGGAWKIHRDFPASDVASRRFGQLSGQCIDQARALRQLLDETPGLASVPSPSPETIESLADNLGGE